MLLAFGTGMACSRLVVTRTRHMLFRVVSYSMLAVIRPLAICACIALLGQPCCSSIRSSFTTA